MFTPRTRRHTKVPPQQCPNWLENRTTPDSAQIVSSSEGSCLVSLKHLLLPVAREPSVCRDFETYETGHSGNCVKLSEAMFVELAVSPLESWNPSLTKTLSFVQLSHVKGRRISFSGNRGSESPVRTTTRNPIPVTTTPFSTHKSILTLNQVFDSRIT